MAFNSFPINTEVGSNNPFPSVLVVEGSTPATPAAGKQRLFVRSSDGHLCRVDSGGTVTDLDASTGGGGGGTQISELLSHESLKRGIAGVGVVSGCTPTAQGSPNMTVAIAAGICKIGTVPITVVVAAANATISTADTTNPRIDLISINSSGTIIVTAGTPAPTPVEPTLPSNSALIAQISVPANDTTISSGQIVDARIILQSSGWVDVIAAADQDISSQTTPQNDNELFFSMTANKLYLFEAVILYSSPVGGGTPDFKFTINGPATLTGQWTIESTYISTTDGSGTAQASVGLATTNAIGTNATPRLVHARGWGYSTGGGSGTAGLMFQWAQNSSGVNATRRLAGSCLRIRQMSP
jgi:hypothetical protein